MAEPINIYKRGNQAIITTNGETYVIPVDQWASFLNSDNLHQKVLTQIESLEPKEFPANSLAQFDPPLGNLELWGAGVTYNRSREARMEEAKKSGGGSFYDRIYEAERPEIFFKATSNRVVGSGYNVYIRKDSDWDVPEPELTLFINSKGIIQGFTIGNDMSSRSIEGENPLYLTQAKLYDGCASLGPSLFVPQDLTNFVAEIELVIIRNGDVAFQGKTSSSQMKRTFEELVEYLFRECVFENGCFLMTGTGIIPSDDFTLQVNDEIRISIDPIGTLVNVVARRD